MGTQLRFQADCDGQTFGGFVVSRGRATAWAGSRVLAGVHIGHAMLWLSRQSPRDRGAVEFRLTGATLPLTEAATTIEAAGISQSVDDLGQQRGV